MVLEGTTRVNERIQIKKKERVILQNFKWIFRNLFVGWRSNLNNDDQTFLLMSGLKTGVENDIF